MEAAQLHCEEILRHLPGRRLVVRASYRGAIYAVKLFFGAHAQRYFNREIQGLKMLQRDGVSAPEIMAELTLTSDAPAVGYGVATRWLADALPVAEDDQAAAAQIARGLGRLHAHGALRTDANLRNYLRGSEGTIYAIDGDGVRSRGKVSRGRGLTNLALMMAEFPPRADVGLAAACEAYAQERWRQPAGPSLLAVVRRRLARQRNLRTGRYLRKTLRECTEFHCQRGGGRLVACSRPAWEQQMQEFVADPETTFAAGTVVKAGNSATVIRTQLDGRRVVIKRYNVKTPWHGVRRSLRWTPRYRVSWRNGHRMDFLRLRTARPIALLEVKRGMFNTVAYLVMEDAGERDLESVVASEGVSALLLDQVVGVFRGLRAAGLVHGDTKASNFLLTDDGICLVDLDAMRPGRDLRKDARRFLGNWDHVPAVRARFADALQADGMPL